MKNVMKYKIFFVLFGFYALNFSLNMMGMLWTNESLREALPITHIFNIIKRLI